MCVAAAVHTHVVIDAFLVYPMGCAAAASRSLTQQLNAQLIIGCGTKKYTQ